MLRNILTLTIQLLIDENKSYEVYLMFFLFFFFFLKSKIQEQEKPSNMKPKLIFLLNSRSIQVNYPQMQI
jgi:hypothetical protein